MKKIIILFTAIFSISLIAKADKNFIHFKPSAQISDTANTALLSQLLTLYYNIKDALVESDAGSAATNASEFVKAVGSIDMKSLSESDHAAFMSVNNKLAYDARHISETKDIHHQREHFKSLSDNFFALAKKVKMSAQPVYQQYCPMKKAYWLSSGATIKNPYFGNQMQDCGKITATLR